MAGTNLTTKEVATRLRRSPRTLERWRLVDYGPPYQRTGRGPKAPVIYPEDAFVEWQRANLVIPGAKATA